MGQNQVIRCKDCGKEFDFTARQQEEFAAKGWGPPLRCPDCRIKRKQSGATPSPGNRENTPHEHHGSVPPTGKVQRLTGYYDSNNHLTREIIVEEAVKEADRFAVTDPPLKMSALRRFFHRVRAIEARYRARSDSEGRQKAFETIRPELDQLLPAVTYSTNRKVVPPVFKDFLTHHVELATRSPQDFEGFVVHFQSVVAYSKARLSE